jgi:hypothetical protein
MAAINELSVGKVLDAPQCCAQEIRRSMPLDEKVETMDKEYGA